MKRRVTQAQMTQGYLRRALGGLTLGVTTLTAGAQQQNEGYSPTDPQMKENLGVALAKGLALARATGTAGTLRLVLQTRCMADERRHACEHGSRRLQTLPAPLPEATFAVLGFARSAAAALSLAYN